MATNPRTPNLRPVPTLAEQKKKKSAAPWVPLGILVAAILLLALIFYLPHTPRASVGPQGAVVPAQPVNGQIQISNVRLSPAPTGGQMYIYATMHNSGSTTVNGVRARVVFDDQDSSKQEEVEGVAEVVQNGSGVGVNMVDDPIKPNESRDVRIPVQNVPATWNHRLPTIQILDVTSVGAKR